MAHMAAEEIRQKLAFENAFGSACAGAGRFHVEFRDWVTGKPRILQVDATDEHWEMYWRDIGEDEKTTLGIMRSHFLNLILAAAHNPDANRCLLGPTGPVIVF